MTTIVFATNNHHKVKEVLRILPGWLSVKSLQDIGCEEELPETGTTLHANAMQKARYVYEKYGVNCFADDTGLEVDALGGEPGVYSARYAGKHASSTDNIHKLLASLKGEANRKARFTTVIALVVAGQVFYFEGSIEGRIMETASGASGFGYDPVFIPDAYDRTFAEMTADEKNTISHRALAVNRMKEWLVENKALLPGVFDTP